MNIQNQIDDELDAVLQDVSTARGLPNAHYVSEEMFLEERQAVLFNNWSGIAFGKDVPETGDAFPVDFLGMPLLVVRKNDGEIGVYQNTCRHRGMILVEEPGKIRGAIRCPYHSWCYGLDGRLVSTPHVGGAGFNTHESIKRDELGLVVVRSYVWRDVVFVNVSGTAPEFEDYAATAMERWKDFDQPVYHGGADSSFTLDVKTNWKLAVENYCESYHLPWVHPGLNSYSRLEDHYHIEEAGKFSGQGTLVYRQFESEDGKTFPKFSNLPEKWDEGAEYLSFYPNVLFGVHKDHAFAIILEPKSLDRTVEHIELYYAQDIANDDAYKAMREKNAALWKIVFQEDVFVVEGMQKGRHGILFDGGKFSPVMDNPTHCFHHWVATQIKANRAA